MSSQFDQDVERIKKRFQGRHERKLGANYRRRVEAEEQLGNAATLNIVLGAVIASALVLWLLL